MNIPETRSVQLIRVDPDSECFYALLIRDDLPIIINAFKGWDAKKLPLSIEPKPNIPVCAQYEGGNLWH
ncbi:unnamed protein product [Rotaria sp. Silwood2]|nr:unnamed protein product [Rotaria sp. Silwood2]CAF3312451.1 unnamed protein product [Rotaria sp. Silwood2]